MEFVRVTMGRYSRIVLDSGQGGDPTRTGEGEEGGWSL